MNIAPSGFAFIPLGLLLLIGGFNNERRDCY